MPSNPTPRDVHVNKPLTNIMIQYLQDNSKFLSPKVAPFVGVPHQSDLYYEWDIADFHRSEMEAVGPGSEAPQAVARLSTSSYFCPVYKLKYGIDDQSRANQDNGPIDLERVKTQLLAQKALIKADKQFQDAAFKPGVWTGSTTGTDIVVANKWDTASSTPIEDIRAEMCAVEEKTGFMPNKLILGRKAWKALQDNAQLIGRYEFNPVKKMNTAKVAELLDLEEVLVASGVVNTAAEGQPAANEFIMSDSALLLYTTSSPSIDAPSAMYTFVWSGLTGINNDGIAVKMYRDEPHSSDMIEAMASYQHKVVAPTLGVFFNGVITP